MPTNIAPDHVSPLSPTHRDQAELERAHKDINYAFRTGILVSGINFFVGFLILANPAISEKLEVNALCLIDAIIILASSISVNNRNRTAAKFLFGYFLLGKLLYIVASGFNPSSMFVGILILYYFYRGMIGTDAYHKISRDIVRSEINCAYTNDSDEEAEPATPTPSIAKPAAEPVEPRNDRFWVADELIKLCGSDRAQAEWLLQEVRMKNPTKSMGSCNEIAIDQIKSKSKKRPSPW
jgi:hypothetical protein